jgi:hypothetical protein
MIVALTYQCLATGATPDPLTRARENPDDDGATPTVLVELRGLSLVGDTHVVFGSYYRLSQVPRCHKIASQVLA